MVNAFSTRSTRVLVVDDNRDAADMVADMLTIVGYETDTAYGGNQALDVATVFSPDVVLLDLDMPDMNGFDVILHLRNLPGLHAVFVMAISGSADAETRRLTTASGFNAHLQKPAQMDQIVSLVECCSALVA